MSKNLPEDRDLEREMLEMMHDYHPDNFDAEDIQPMFVILFSILLPVWYIYSWVVCKSFYHELSSTEQTSALGPGVRRQNRVVAWSVATPVVRKFNNTKIVIDVINLSLA